MNQPLKRTQKLNDLNNSKPENDSDSVGETDVVSFWLLLLFVATFFGIAAEEARRPTMFQSASLNPSVRESAFQPVAYNVDGTPLPAGASDSRGAAARRFDLSSVERDGSHGSVGSKLETPATGK